jgi:hypothetical protein
MLSSAPEFIPFPKMARLSRDVVITEKIDGTSGQVLITEDGRVIAGSRTRYITPEDDNFGFAAWVRDNSQELMKLGAGRHFGEWWGQGIQRKYGLDHKRFSLFNTARWSDDMLRPACCHVVPVLLAGVFTTERVELALDRLRHEGSYAAPGFMKPEGVVVFHTAANFAFKKTIEKDEQPKSVRV